jgi:hypothetical protein
MKKQPLKTTSKKISSKVTAAFGKNSKVASTFDDFKTAVLVISLLGNAVVLISWLVLHVTTQYDEQIATFLFVR